jgi:quercetin dioxygenase-like cupin family protein
MPAKPIPPIDHQVKRDVGATAELAPWGSVEWAVREGDPPGAEQTFAIAVFDPGESNAEHTHPNCEEIVYVMEGELEHTLGGQRTRLVAGDLIVVPRGVPHRLINTGAAPARTVIVFSSPDRQFVPTGG